MKSLFDRMADWVSSKPKAFLVLLLIVIFFLLVVVFTSKAEAAGSWSTPEFVCVQNSPICSLTSTFTADSGDGTVPDLVFSSTVNAAVWADLKGKFLYGVKTNPGATAPTDNWDAYVKDQHAIDLMELLLENRDTTASEEKYPSVPKPIGPNTTLTISASGNVVNSAIVLFEIFILR